MFERLENPRRKKAKPRRRPVYKRIRVPASSYLRRVKGKKRRVRVRVRAHYRYLRVKTRLIRRPKAIRRRKKLLRPRRERAAISWIPLREFVADLFRRYKKLVIDDSIYRTSEKTDVIDLGRQFIWTKPVKAFNRRTIGEYIHIVRVWALAYHRGDKRHIIRSLTRSYGRPEVEGRGQKYAPGRFVLTDFPSAEKAAQELVDDMKEWTKGHDYIEFRGLIAWTLWGT